MKFKVKVHRNPKDFTFGSFRYEQQTDGGLKVYARDKKKKAMCLYMEVYRVG